MERAHQHVRAHTVCCEPQAPHHSHAHSAPAAAHALVCVQLLAVMAVMYAAEPLLGRVYVTRGIRALERVLASLRAETFRVLLMQPIAFFDKHGATELTNVLAVDLDTLRSCVFSCAALAACAAVAARGSAGGVAGAHCARGCDCQNCVAADDLPLALLALSC